MTRGGMGASAIEENPQDPTPTIHRPRRAARLTGDPDYDCVECRHSRRRWMVGIALSATGLLLTSAETRSADVSAAGAPDNPLGDPRVRVQHLYRRAGFGLSPAEREAALAAGWEAALEQLLNPEHVPDDELEGRLAQKPFDWTKLADMQRWWLLRMIHTRRPLLEKMTLFWHGLLTSATSRVGLPNAARGGPNLMAQQNAFFRENALSDFSTLLHGISRDPAMLVYLDGQLNRKQHPNENFARELMELFSMGVGNYSERDIQESARAFSGWGLTPERQFIFRPGQHDNGEKTFLGRAGNWNGDDVVNIILEQPVTSEYLARRLFSFFAYPDPAPEAVAPVVDALRKTGYSVKAALRALFTSPAFWSPRAYRAQIKGPIEYVVGLVRLFGLETDAAGLGQAATRMGQALFNPPNVAGWPGGAEWLSSSAWLERLNLANRLLTQRKPPKEGTRPWDAPGWVTRAGLRTPEQVAGALLDVLADGRVAPEAQKSMLEYLAGDGKWPADGLLAANLRHDQKATLDTRIRGAAYLVAAMPECQLG